MAQWNGYIVLDQNEYSTYDEWRAFCTNNGMNFDYYTESYGWGNQCVDVPVILWYQYGLNFKCGSVGYAYMAWTVDKYTNAQTPFIAIDDPTQIKRGDCVIFSNAINTFGHVGFADEDYATSADPNYLNMLGQNEGQGVWNTVSIVAPYPKYAILGAFRNTYWNGVTPPTPPTPPPTPPTPPPTPAPYTSYRKFPWVLKGRKTRNQL